jgi:hypothetical protein
MSCLIIVNPTFFVAVAESAKWQTENNGMINKIMMQGCLAFLLALPAVAQDRMLELYFSNDSLNGFQYSDAYETHDMGARYAWGHQFVDLNLGLVSPDMWTYRNMYRPANRSFGELVKLSYGVKGVHEAYGSYELMGQIKAAGNFGLDAMQDLMHELLNLQQVAHLEARVRMPSAVWFGVGAKTVIPDVWQSIDFEGNVYLGSDRASLKTGLAYQVNDWRFGVAGEHVFYDNVVSAGPIFAAYRHSIPSVYLRRAFQVFEKTVIVENRISLPTISSDDSIFSTLSMQLELPLK